MMLSEEQAREHLRQIVLTLESVRLQLLGLQVSLSEPPAERIKLLDVEDMDASAVLRTGISCALTDWIDPALSNLRNLADPEKT
jgi:hypothetical protein